MAPKPMTLAEKHRADFRNRVAGGVIVLVFIGAGVVVLGRDAKSAFPVRRDREPWEIRD